MAIDIPPQMPPAEASVASIEAAKAQSIGVVSASFGNYAVDVIAPPLLPSDKIKEVIAASETPSQAVLKLDEAYYRAGYLLIRTSYALVGNKLSLFVVQGELDNVIAPPAVTPFFKPLIGDKNLTREEFDRRRLLADIKSTRAGENGAISYIADAQNPRKVTMVIKATADEEHSPSEFSVQFGNPGNRFLGRYYQQTAFRYSTDYGTEVVVGWESALTSLGDDPVAGKSYNSYQLALDHPTVLGLYGFDIEFTDYEFEADPDDASAGDTTATIETVGLNGQQVLYSSPYSKVTLNQRLEHIEFEAENSNSDLIFVDEPHTTFEFGGTWFYRFASGTNVTTGLAVEAGLSSDAGTLMNSGAITAPADGEVSPYNRTSEFSILKPRFGVAVPVFTSGNLSFDVIGQVADEQVPQEQQWVLGGTSSISAYLPGILVGDTGYYARAALSFGKFNTGGFKWSPSIFAEHGSAEFENADSDLAANQLADGANLAERSSIGDAGVRLEASYGDTFELELVAADGFSDDNISEQRLEDNDADFFFRVKAKF